MFLIIVGTGAMGQIIRECAAADGDFEKIVMVEPLENNWPEEKADLLIDFSHPESVRGIYEYCRIHRGGIPVVIGTTGHSETEEQLIGMIEKICPLVRKSNFSRGIEAINHIAVKGKEMLPAADIRIEEVHHTKKKDAPSGTAKTLGEILEVGEESMSSLRMGNVVGVHKVYFALEDEEVEIVHRAHSKRIFAQGAIEAGKKVVSRKRNNLT